METSDRPGDEYQIGQIVRLKADPSRSGPIIDILTPVDGRGRYRVYHSASVVRDYFEDQLQEVASSDEELPAALLADGRWLTPEVFLARLTAARLRHPQIDHLYALRSARIQFIPFQFKPLLRFLRADRPRMLIADEVGVGKTIEAGLILKELQTRQRVDSVLVICPKALTGKWRIEMRRFDEEFRILTSESLRYCLIETHRDGAWPLEYSRAIVHYELFRMEQYLLGGEGRASARPGLLELQPPPTFTLLIADEAHHLRTPGSSSHQLAEFLCQVSEAVLMLSATPVQLHSNNLFSLLNLLRPDLFADRALFAEVLEPNRHLTRAIRMLRSGPAGGEDWQQQAAAALDTAGSTRWGREVVSVDPRYAATKAALAGPLGDEERVSCIRSIEELHSLAHVMNRTRRRDIGRFTVREPHTVSVPFTAEQQKLYDELLAFRRGVLSLVHDPTVVSLVIDTLERQAASSLHALAPTLDDVRLGRGLAATTDAAEEDDVPPLPPALLEQAATLAGLARGLPEDDPKLDALLKIVSETMDVTDGPGKALVFSFFLHTIGYLEERLRSTGVRVGVVTGKIHDEERESLRNRFRLDRSHHDAIDVLLSSEVGCEGLDYEFCDRLVNYDIPWNPMRIEQRIGRIDRFGQRADKVMIFNFVTPGTVEERVFYRCFERLGIFRDTVGDLEEVLGDVVEDLNRIALDPALSPPQAEERARQLADNAIRLAEEQRRLEAESGELLGLDEAFTDEVESILDGRRFVSDDELRRLVEAFMADAELGGRLVAVEKDVLHLRLPEAGRAELARLVRGQDRNDRTTVEFLRWLGSGERVLPVTFIQEIAAARRDVPFITPVHPLARAAVEHWTSPSEPLLGGIAVSSGSAQAGTYVFVCDLWETVGVRPDVRLMAFVVDAFDGRPAADVAEALMSLLGVAEGSTPSTEVKPEAMAERLHQLDVIAETRRRQTLVKLTTDNDLLLARRLTSLERFHESRLRRVQGELAQAVEARIVRMKTSELSRFEADYDRRRRALEGGRDVEILSRRIAAGVLEVRHAE